MKKYLILFLLTVVFVTQKYPRDISYPKGYGQPIYTIRKIGSVKNIKIYNPIRFFKISKNLKDKTFSTYMLYNFVLLGTTPIYLVLALNVAKKNKNVYGNARFANREEVKKMSLKNKKGVVLGKFKGKILRSIDVFHVIIMASTRMGKGINNVLTTLFDWEDSVIVNDIKGECWEKTSGYRSKVLKQNVMMFDPTSEDPTWTFNPLDEIRLKTKNEVEDVTLIVQTLLDDGLSKSDPYWLESAINIIKAVIIHLKYIEINTSLSDVYDFISRATFDEDIKEILGIETDDEGNDIVTENTFEHVQDDTFFRIYGKKQKLHPIVEKSFSQYYKTPSKTRGSTMAVAYSKLEIFNDPKIKANTQTSSFTIKELKEKKTSLYLVTPPSAQKMTRPLTRLIYSLGVYQLTPRMKFNHRKKSFLERVLNFSKNKIEKFVFKEKPKNRILFLIDEFPVLGKLSIIEEAVAYVAGYGIKMMLICQSIKQLKAIYGKDSSIMENMGIKVFMTPNDEDTPEMLSKMLGNKTEVITTSSKKGIDIERSFSTSIVSSPLMTPAQISNLPYEKIFIRIIGFPFILGEKIFYYKDKAFRDKENYEPPTYQGKEVKIEKEEKYEEENLEIFDETEKDIKKAIEQAQEDNFNKNSWNFN